MDNLHRLGIVNMYVLARRVSVFFMLLYWCFIAVAAEQRDVLGTKVSLTPPPKFEPSVQFPGFQRPDAGAAIIVTEIPGPISAVLSGMTEEGLASKGMTLLNSEEIQVAGHPALLIHVTQERSGTTFEKWVVMFGTDAASVMIGGSFPQTFSEQLTQPIRQALLSANWDLEKTVNLFDGLDFYVTQTEKLAISNRISNVLMFTKANGKKEPGPSDPLYLVGPAISPVEITDVENFARQRIAQTARIRDLHDIQAQSISVADLNGYEIIAQASDVKTDTPLTVYQALLPSGKNYYLFQGIVGTNQAKEYLTEFRTITNSFERTQ